MLREAKLNQAFLKRACVQFSCQLSHRDMNAAVAETVAFVAYFAPHYSREVVRALVWRVVESEAGADRLGAWKLLNEVMNLAERPEFSATINDLFDFVPHLVACRWDQFTPLETSSGVAALMGTEGEAPVIAHELSKGYDDIARHWANTWNRAIVADYKREINMVKVGGPSMLRKSKTRTLLEVPRKYQDLLWKLRRKSPRPRLAHEVWMLYRKDDAAEAVPDEAEVALCKEPRAAKVKEWLRRLIGATFCLDCDSWNHSLDHCRCSCSHVASLPTISRTGAEVILSVEGIENPRDPRPSEVLDAVTQRIAKHAPFDNLLSAFDAIRGRSTTPEERCALSIHASYGVLPSKTVFSTTTSTCEKMKSAMESSRRYGEWDAFHQSVKVLSAAFVSGTLDAQQQASLEAVKQAKSFLFVLFDPTMGASPDVSIFPKHVRNLKSVRSRLCTYCLATDHTAGECPEAESGLSWDQRIAADLLARNDLTGARSGDEIIAAKLRPMTDLQADELRLAVRVLIDGKVSYCRACRVYGHSGMSCLASINAALRQVNLSETDARLFPTQLQQCIQQSFAEGDKKKAQSLQAAQASVATRLYPCEFGNAVALLRQENVNIAAARFFPNLVAAASEGKPHVVRAVGVLGLPTFPDPCVLCNDASCCFAHDMVACPHSTDNVRALLKHLRDSHNMQLHDVVVPTTAASRAVATELANGSSAHSRAFHDLMTALNYIRDNYCSATAASATQPTLHCLSQRCFDMAGIKMSRIIDSDLVAEKLSKKRPPCLPNGIHPAAAAGHGNGNNGEELTPAASATNGGDFPAVMPQCSGSLPTHRSDGDLLAFADEPARKLPHLEDPLPTVLAVN